jgi:hypothetical protein
MIVRASVEIEVPDDVNANEVIHAVNSIVGEHIHQWKFLSGWHISRRERVGFQGAADALADISGRNFSRQGTYRLWTRRAFNGFPEQHVWVVNGLEELAFDKKEVLDWWRNRAAH